ncbi:MAG: alginate lyase family protein [Gemmatimonadaceae bacterium]
MSVFRHLAKLRGRSRAELVERGGQWLAMSAERLGVRGAREPQPEEIARDLDPSAFDGVATLEAWFERHRAGTATSFFAGLDDRVATVAALRDLVPNAEGELLARTERMLSGEFDLLGFRGLRYPLPIDWHRDPISGVRAPLDHWSRIAYLDPSVAGDHKRVWEINRHHVLVSLGQAYWYTGDERWAEQALTWLDEWMDANPPKRGVNWASSLEVAFRGIAWVWTLQLLRESPHLTPARFTRALGFLTLSARHIERFLSTYFSPNTHLTGEALGLYVIGTQLAPLAEARGWRSRGLAVLLDQLPRHVRPDGVYFEQATYYQRYTIDFYLHLLILAERCGDRVDDRTPALLEKLVLCLQAIERPDGTIPLLGDDDGGRLLSFDGRGGEDIRAPLATAATLFGHAEFAFGAQGPSAELVWLLGPSGAARWRTLEPRAPLWGSRAFVDGGLYVMRDRWSANASLMVLDCGPHGIFNCGHAHADALSFDLTVDGHPVLVDPGTFTYTAGAEWRDHFRSTAAHNAVSINDESSSEMQGPFAWRSVAASTLERWHASAVIDYFDGTHDGFERPTVDAETARRVLYAKAGYWIVRDMVASTARFDAAATWQCAEGISLEAGTDHSFTARTAERDVLRIHVLGPPHPSDATSTIEAGWVSPAYGIKVAAPRLRVQVRASGPLTWETVLASPRLQATVVRRRGASGDIVEVRHGDFVDRTVFCDGDEHAAIDGVDTDADVFFLRRRASNGEPCEVFASGATRLAVDGTVLASSPLPGAFALARESGEWRRRMVGATALALGTRETLGSASRDVEGSVSTGEFVATPGAHSPYFSP